MFVSDTDRVPVSVDGANTVYIRPRMSFGIQQKVASAMLRLADADNEQGMSSSYDLGAYQTAMMTHNVVGWEGPAFRDERGQAIPCTPANILRLDPDEPLVKRVLQELTERNTPKASPDPNLPTPTGSTNGGNPSFGASSSGVVKTEG
jgi:hypothetical protein